MLRIQHCGLDDFDDLWKFSTLTKEDKEAAALTTIAAMS